MAWLPKSRVAPPADAVDIWRIRLSGSHSEFGSRGFSAATLALLDATERGRAQSFVRSIDGLRYATTHQALRNIVSRYTGIPPGELAWETNAQGKPRLASPPPVPLEFNLSHSGDWALVAVAASSLGVDLERLRPVSHLAGMIARWCTPAEQARLAVASPAGSVAEGAVTEVGQEPTPATSSEASPAELPTQAFFRCWTAKEALLKAVGCGLHVDASRIETPPPRAGFAGLQIPATISSLAWQVAWLEIDHAHLGAVVTSPQVHAIRQLDWLGEDG